MADRSNYPWDEHMSMRNRMEDDFPINDPLGEMEFDVTLAFQFTNAYGANIYKDPWD